MEQSLLQEHLDSKPSDVLVVLGPRDSGKMRLLQEVLLEDRCAEQPKAKVSYTNGQGQVLHNSSGLATAFLKQGARQHQQAATTTGEAAAAFLDSAKLDFDRGWFGSFKLSPGSALRFLEGKNARELGRCHQRLWSPAQTQQHTLRGIKLQLFTCHLHR